MFCSEELESLSPTSPSDRIQDKPTILVPKTPEDIGRYEVANRHVEALNHPIPPLLFCDPLGPFDPRTKELPQLWDKYIHPEGMPYYRHRKMQIVTFSDIGDTEVYELISRFLEEIRTRIRTRLPPGSVLPDSHQAGSDEWHYGLPHWEICVSIEASTGHCLYYIADWEKRCTFWLEGDTDDIHCHDGPPLRILNSSELGLLQFVSYEHLQMSLECQFWKHVEFFPEHRDLPADAYQELQEWFLWAITDRMTSLESTVVYSISDMQGFLEILTCRNWEQSLRKGYLNAVVARHWNEIAGQRVHNMYGEHTARLNRNQSRFFQPLHRLQPTLWTRLICVILLYKQPFTWYDKLSESWVDKTVFVDSWKDILRDAQEEWKRISVLATVMLAANIGFLAIDSLETSDAGTAVVARTLSAVSTIFSFGSIMSSLLLLHDYQEMSKPTFTVQLANEYLERCRRHAAGLFGAAMVFSLPFAMTMWSLVFFLTSILTYFHVDNPFWSSFVAYGIAGSVLIILVVQMSYFFGRARPKKASEWTAPVQPKSTKWIPSPRASFKSMCSWSRSKLRWSSQSTLPDTANNGPSPGSGTLPATQKRRLWWLSGSTMVEDEDATIETRGFRRMFSFATVASQSPTVASALTQPAELHINPPTRMFSDSVMVMSPTTDEPPPPITETESAEKVHPPDDETQSVRSPALIAWLRSVLRVITGRFRASPADDIEAGNQARR